MKTAYNQKIKLAAFLIILASFSAAAILRNPVWENRLTLWKHVAERSPEKVRGHYNLGNAFTAFNMYEDAIREYQIAIDINPYFFHGNVHGAIGIVYVKKGLLDKAFDEFQTALKINPHSARPHYGLGIIYEQKGNLNEAVSEYNIATAIEPDYSEPYAALGILYGKKDMLREAKYALERAVQLYPEDAHQHYNLAVILDRLGDFRYAILHYREFLERGSKKDNGLYVRFSRNRIIELERYIQE